MKYWEGSSLVGAATIAVRSTTEGFAFNIEQVKNRDWCFRQVKHRLKIVILICVPQHRASIANVMHLAEQQPSTRSKLTPYPSRLL